LEARHRYVICALNCALFVAESDVDCGAKSSNDKEPLCEQRATLLDDSRANDRAKAARNSLHDWRDLLEIDVDSHDGIPLLVRVCGDIGIREGASYFAIGDKHCITEHTEIDAIGVCNEVCVGLEIQCGLVHLRLQFYAAKATRKKERA
jgi:hypothetical protein